MKNSSFISSDPGVMRGALVITGTRVPMVRILYLLKEGYTIDQIHDQYDWVSKEKIKGAIAELSTKLDNSDYGAKILQTQNPAG
ncbi:hypothetical protein A3B39_01235 [Candidatus Daviesbacteria bacterium RIFCSPLOWO2_01_FULL_37_10]|nr:MAG: hypothetical protein A3B39_01235 [Candidatus Daviesbacteria bacterium RIFCSPLOWO2_01_FULL_37_10]